MPLYRFADKFMKIVAVLFTALIFISAFIFTATNYDMTSHWFTLTTGNILPEMIGAVCILGAGLCIHFLAKNNLSRVVSFLVILVIGWYFIACEYMAFFGRSMPNSDAWVVYAMSKQMAEGDLSIIHPTGSYMSYYPQQIGLCAFLSIFIRIINLFRLQMEPFHILKALYGIFECVSIFFLHKTVKNIWGDHADFWFLFLSIFNLPYIMYSSYLYGEVPALMFFALGAYFVSSLCALKGRPMVDMVLGILSFALAVMTRKNTLVLIIGVVIALAFETINKARLRYLVMALLIGATSVVILPLTVKYYEAKSGSTLTKGVTPLSYIAMGMQDISPTVNEGWYTGFNFTTFEDSGCDVDLANEISREEIRARKEYFKENPKYAMNFYKKKFLTQWVDGTYFSAESTNVYYGERSSFLLRVYEGDLRQDYILVCNIYQSVVFFGSFFWALCNLKKHGRDELWKSFIFIGVFGGFLFHMLWEANSRYILTYACLLVPYAAVGFSDILRLNRKK